MNKMSLAPCALLWAALAAPASAQQPIIYPAKGQSAQQQQTDEGECHVWAKNQTGVDPAAMAAAPAPPPPSNTVGGGERARGAARGAVGGAAIGAIAGDTGKGAAAGAVVGTVRGGREARQKQGAQQQSVDDQRAQQLDTYNRAIGACLEARGYTVR
jgi:hypothetical protein